MSFRVPLCTVLSLMMALSVVLSVHSLDVCWCVVCWCDVCWCVVCRIHGMRQSVYHLWVKNMVKSTSHLLDVANKALETLEKKADPQLKREYDIPLLTVIRISI